MALVRSCGGLPQLAWRAILVVTVLRQKSSSTSGHQRAGERASPADTHTAKGAAEPTTFERDREENEKFKMKSSK